MTSEHAQPKSAASDPSAGAAPANRLGLAGTTGGQAVISVVLVAICFTLAVWNLPESSSRRQLMPLAEPISNTLGLRQSWSVFAPDPSTTSVALHALIVFDDGSEEIFKTPRAGSISGMFRSERWRKWETRARRDNQKRYWKPTAQWMARTYGSSGRAVERVELTRVFSTTPTPGSDTERQWKRFTFYTYDVGADRGVELEGDSIPSEAP